MFFVVTDCFWNAVVYFHCLVDNSRKEPVVAVINGNDDLVLFADVVSLQGPGDHLL